MALRSKDRLRMELNAEERPAPVLNRHHGSAFGPGVDSQIDGQGRTFGHEGVIPAGHELAGRPAKSPLPS